MVQPAAGESHTGRGTGVAGRPGELKLRAVVALIRGDDFDDRRHCAGKAAREPLGLLGPPGMVRVFAAKTVAAAAQADVQRRGRFLGPGAKLDGERNCEGENGRIFHWNRSPLANLDWAISSIIPPRRVLKPHMPASRWAALSPFAPRKWHYFRGAKGDAGLSIEPAPGGADMGPRAAGFRRRPISNPTPPAPTPSVRSSSRR